MLQRILGAWSGSARSTAVLQHSPGACTEHGAAATHPRCVHGARRCCNASSLHARSTALLQAVLGTQGALAKSTALCKPCWVPLQRCMALLQAMHGARGVLAKVHGVGATQMWCTRCPCKSARHCCNPDVVHEVLLQSCMALLQPMLGARVALAKVHGIGATQMWCMRCPCRGAWRWCNPCLVHVVLLQR